MVAGEEGECRLPESGHYANSDGEEQACTKPIGLESEWLPTPEEGLAEDKCPFTCSPSAEEPKKEGETPACNPPEGKYIDIEGEVRSCVEASGLITDSTSFGGQPQQVSNPNQCPFTCEAGYVVNIQGRSCDLPTTGNYANTEGANTPCRAITGDTGGFDAFKDNTIPVVSPTGCDFACTTGFVKNKVAGTCTFPSPGKYADAQGGEQDCNLKLNSNWASNTEAVLTADDCAFTCTAGTTKNPASKTCDSPDSGVWYNSGTKTSCTAISHQSGWIPSLTHLISDICDFNCHTGYKKVGRACNSPTPGTYFRPSDDSEVSCNPIPNLASWVAGPASTATDCDFICTAGYVKDKGASTCSPPSGGQWADGGIAKPCTPIQHSVWTSPTGAVSSAVTCLFSCKSGFSKNGRNCDLPSGHFIASDGTAQSCGVRPTSSTGWEAIQSGVNQAQNCVFTCAAGRAPVGAGSNRKCNVKEGYMLANPSSNTAATACSLGEVSNKDRSDCKYPPKGYYSDASRTQKPCGKAPASSMGWWRIAQNPAVSRAQDCAFTCASGRTASGTGSSGSCTLNDGHFPASTALNSAGTACVSHPATSTGWAADQSSVTRQDDCIFECGTGLRVQGTGSSGSCALIGSCSSGQTLNGDKTQCMPNQKACQVADGTGQETWDPTSDDYINCGITGCDAGFHKQSSQCVAVSTGYVSTAGSTTQTQCQGSQKPNAQKSTCVLCDQAGFYVNGGVCYPVDLGFISAAGTRTQTECTGKNIPNNDKSACEQSDCPLNFVLIPNLADYADTDFCVAKYEMKNDGSGKAVSKPQGKPWVLITRSDAITKCTSRGSHYDLMTNDEWQVVARNIELVGSNWSGGTVGSGEINQGNNDYNNIGAASPDDSQACEGTDQTCDENTWHTQRRTFKLSTGEVLWDIGTNAGEWVKESIPNTISEGDIISERDIEKEANLLETQPEFQLTFGQVLRGPKGHFGPSGNYGSRQGVIQDRRGMGNQNYFSEGPDLIRGGNGGIFHAESLTGSGSTIGFRCVYSDIFLPFLPPQS